MQIDWITLGAQLLNFLVLVLLLRHFLYGRITGVIDRREEEIASRRAEAEEALERAEEEAQSHRQAREELDRRRQEMLREAREEAEEERERRLEEARADVARARESWSRGLQRQKRSLLRDLRRSAESATYAGVSRALEDLAGQDLEGRVVDRFVERLRERGGDEELRRALVEAGEPRVRTAFELDEDQRNQISSVLREAFGLGDPPVFQRDPELVLGLRLEAGDYVVGWSGRDYVRALEERVGAILDREGGGSESRDEDGERTPQQASEAGGGPSREETGEEVPG